MKKTNTQPSLGYGFWDAPFTQKTPSKEENLINQPYYHKKANRAAAEQLLSNKPDDTYLFRPSSYSGKHVLSMVSKEHENGPIVHYLFEFTLIEKIKIGEEEYNSLEEFLELISSGQKLEPLNSKEKNLVKQPYYQKVDQVMAEQLLLNKPEGTYLLRPSSYSGKHAFSIVSKKHVYGPIVHFLFEFTQAEKIKIGKKEYNSLEELLELISSNYKLKLNPLNESEAQSSLTYSTFGNTN